MSWSFSSPKEDQFSALLEAYRYEERAGGEVLRVKAKADSSEKAALQACVADYVKGIRHLKDRCLAHFNAILIVLGGDGLQIERAPILIRRFVQESAMFATLFGSDWQCEENNEYIITPINHAAFSILLDYFHEVDILEHHFATLDSIDIELLLHVLVEANFYLVDLLVGKLIQFLFDRHVICAENVLSFWIFARCYQIRELERRCFDLIATSCVAILASDDPETARDFIERCSFEDIRRIFECNWLNVDPDDEFKLYSLFERWVCADSARRDRRASIKLVLDSLRCATWSQNQINALNTSIFASLFESSWLFQQEAIANAHCKLQQILREQRGAARTIAIAQLNTQYQSTRMREAHSLLFVVGGWAGQTSTSRVSGPVAIVEVFDPRAGLWIEDVASQFPQPRAYHGLLCIGDSLFVVGGFDGQDHVSSCFKMNVANCKWERIADMASRRCYVSVAALNGRVFALGGFDSAHRLNTVEFHDPIRNVWSFAAPMNDQRSDADACVVRGKLYVIGGFNGVACLSTAECFDEEANSWTILPPMRTRRSGVRCVAIADRFVFVLGGFNGSSRLRSVEAFDTETKKWLVKRDMITQRSNFSCAVLGDYIYVFGGFDGEATTDKCERCHVPSEKWEELCPMDVPRSAIACCAVTGYHLVSRLCFRYDRVSSSHDRTTSVLPYYR